MPVLQLLTRSILAAILALAPGVSAALAIETAASDVAASALDGALQSTSHSRHDAAPIASATEAVDDTSDDADLPELQAHAAILPAASLLTGRTAPFLAGVANTHDLTDPVSLPPAQRGPPASLLAR